MICEATLLKYGGLRKDDPLFERCVTRLFSLCKSFLKVFKAIHINIRFLIRWILIR